MTNTEWTCRVIDGIGDTVFAKSPDVDKEGMSVEDKQFLSIKDQEVYRKRKLGCPSTIQVPKGTAAEQQTSRCETVANPSSEPTEGVRQKRTFQNFNAKDL